MTNHLLLCGGGGGGGGTPTQINLHTVSVMHWANLQRIWAKSTDCPVLLDTPTQINLHTVSVMMTRCSASLGSPLSPLASCPSHGHVTLLDEVRSCRRCFLGDEDELIASGWRCPWPCLDSTGTWTGCSVSATKMVKEKVNFLITRSHVFWSLQQRYPFTYFLLSS